MGSAARIARCDADREKWSAGRRGRLYGCMNGTLSPQARAASFPSLPSFLSLALLAGGCGSTDKSTDAATQDAALQDAAADNAQTALLVARPYQMYVPSAYDPAAPTPLVVMFHGYSGSGPEQESYYFGLIAASESKRFLYAFPNGTIDEMGNRFWNATDACCDFYHTQEDDVAYLDAVVDDIATKYNVDAKRVFAVGASNGGYMAHRLGCDLSSRFAAIVSVSGAAWNDPSRCPAETPVSVIEIHGDQDTTVAYDGGTSTGGGVYPSALQTVATWAQKDGCTGALADTGTTLDLVPSLAGDETHVASYAGCPPGIDVQLWTIQGGGHVPPLDTTTFGELMWMFMSTHAKPGVEPSVESTTDTSPSGARGLTASAAVAAGASITDPTIATFGAAQAPGIPHLAPYAYADTGLTAPTLDTSSGALAATIATGVPSTTYPWAQFGILFDGVYDLSVYNAVKLNVSGALNPGCAIQFSLVDQVHSASPPFGTCVVDGAQSCFPGGATFDLPTSPTDVTIALSQIAAGAPSDPVFSPRQAMGVQWQFVIPSTSAGDASGGCTGSVTVRSLAFITL
jgi:polyhydroxybutyrate depolymerase